MPDQLQAGSELVARVAVEVMGYEWCPPYTPRIGGQNPPYHPGGAWKLPDGSYRISFRPDLYWSAAGEVLEKLREMWTEATNGASGFDDDFPKPFDDGAFFNSLHRHADRRWPWAFLYATPLAICRAALAAVEAKQ
jgi:hypothetical protein